MGKGSGLWRKVIGVKKGCNMGKGSGLWRKVIGVKKGCNWKKVIGVKKETRNIYCCLF